MLNYTLTTPLSITWSLAASTPKAKTNIDNICILNYIDKTGTPDPFNQANLMKRCYGWELMAR